MIDSSLLISSRMNISSNNALASTHITYDNDGHTCNAYSNGMYYEIYRHGPNFVEPYTRNELVEMLEQSPSKLS